MAPNEDSNESLASPDDRENLPGELLGHDLVDPGSYEVAADEVEAEELVPGQVPPPASDDEDVEVDDPSQLAAAESAAQQARSSRPVRKSVGPTRTEGKGGATPSRRRTSGQAAASRPTGPVQFVGESIDELKKVVWPSWTMVQQYFWAVLVFVLIVIAYVGLLDLGFGWVLLRLFG